ncbi:MAG: hypothetical protein O3B24_06780 [Verrucomicrobia bacterium]|nr:hypothetical protein [Verrucomicrobiota bacterium]
MNSQRKLKRFQLITTLVALDPMGVKQVGVVVDLTVEGLGLSVMEALEVGRRYSMRVLLPDTLNGVDHFLVTGACRWCRRASNPDLYDVGMLLENVPPDITEIIEEVIRRFGR